MEITKKIKFILAIIIILNSCKKHEDSARHNVFETVRSFDDTMCNPHVFKCQIASGNNRIFMVYGTGDGRNLNQDDIQIRYVVTDNNGKLITTGNVPPPSTLYRLMALSDGNFLMVWIDIDKSDVVHFYKYDNNGILLSKKTLVIPNRKVLSNVYKAKGDQVILHVYDVNYSDNSSEILGCNSNGGVLWSKMIQVGFRPVLLDDGGYIYNVGITSLYYQGTKIVRVNSKFDTIWTKNIYRKGSFSADIFPIQLKDKFVIRLGFFESWYFATNRFEYLHLNSTGDSIDNSYLSSIGRHKTDGTVYSSSYKSDGIFYINPDRIFVLNAVSSGTTIFSSGNVRTYYQIFDSDLNLIDEVPIQKQTVDRLESACMTSDGKIACFGLFRPYQKPYYKPTLVLIKNTK